MTHMIESSSAHLAIKAPCRAATTGNIALSGLQTIDGVALAAGDRVLVRVQASLVDNGIWIAGSGTWHRAEDFDGTLDAVGGTQALVTSGATYAGTVWRVAGDQPVDVRTDSVAFEQQEQSGGSTGTGSAAGAAFDIGLFTAAAAADVPPAIELVRTTGYAQIGKGAAAYAYDPAVDAAYVTANPRSAFRTSDGRGFRLALDQTINPQMFGAIGNRNLAGIWYLEAAQVSALSDDTAALQAFFDFIQANHVLADWGGAYGVTAGLTMGGASTDTVQRSFAQSTDVIGSCVLVPKSAISGAVLTLTGHPHGRFGPLAITHELALNYSARKYDIGLLWQARSQMVRFSTIQCHFAKLFGVLARSRTGNYLGSDNIFCSEMGTIYTYGCGSGADADSAFLTASYSGRTEPVAAVDPSQRTRFVVTALPPAALGEPDGSGDGAGTGEYPDTPLFAMFPGSSELYAIKAIDRSAMTIDLYPKVDTGTAATGTVKYVYGGGIGIMGGDAGVMSGKLVASGCGIGVWNSALYPGWFNATVQHNAIGYVPGLSDSSSLVGGGLEVGYFEANLCDIYWNAGGAETHMILNQHALALSKIHWPAPRLGSNVRMGGYEPRNLVINYNGVLQRAVLPRNDAVGGKGFGASFIDFSKPASDIMPLWDDNPTVYVVATAETPEELQRTLGRRVRLVSLEGSAATGAPTGAFSVVPPAGWTVNEGGLGSTATFTGFTASALAQIALEVTAAAPNLRVTFLGGK